MSIKYRAAGTYMWDAWMTEDSGTCRCFICRSRRRTARCRGRKPRHRKSHIASFDLADAPAELEFCCKLTMDAKAAGIFVDADISYVIALESDKGRVFAGTLYSFEYLAAREIPLEKNRKGMFAASLRGIRRTSIWTMNWSCSSGFRWVLFAESDFSVKTAKRSLSLPRHSNWHNREKTGLDSACLSLPKTAALKKAA